MYGGFNDDVTESSTGNNSPPNLYSFKSVAKFLWLLYSSCGRENLLVPILANFIGIIRKRSCRGKGRLDIKVGKISVSAI